MAIQGEFISGKQCELPKAVNTASLGGAGIGEILLNLAGNSIKFTSETSSTFNLKLIKQTRNDANLRFAVNDTATGIAADENGTIFKPFRLAQGHSARNYGNSGLGLAISKNQVGTHRSKTSLDGTTGKGPGFWLTVKFNKDKQILIPIKWKQNYN